MNMKWVHMIAWILVMAGGINWGLTGLGGFMNTNWNIFYLVLGSMPTLEWLVYILVGLAAVYEIVTHKKNCNVCGTTSSSTPSMM